MESKEVDPDIAEFAHAVGQLVRKLRNAADAQDLSWTQTAVMARLDREGPMTTADLARAEGVKPQSMGAIVSALEELEIVERQPHPTDGRQVHIRLTAKGAVLRQNTRDAKINWLAVAFEKLSDEERETLVSAGKIVKRLAA
jgi:DNA-binding MarR family transcriptional regulator